MSHLWAQIVLPISVVLVLSAMLVGVWAQRITVREATQAAERETVRLAETISRLIIGQVLDGTSFQLDLMLDSVQDEGILKSIAVLDPYGLTIAGTQALGSSGVPATESDLFRDVLTQGGGAHRRLESSIVVYWAVPYLDGVVGAVRIERLLDDVVNDAQAVKSRNLAVMLGATGLLIIVCLVIVKRSTARLNRLTTVVRAVKEGDWGVTVEPSGYDEIGDLERGFQTMLSTVSSTMKESEALAYQDGVTQLPNRACFLRSLRAALAYGQGDIHGHILFIDLDRFKAVNDVMGHSAGDRVLKEVAQRLQSVVETCPARKTKLARIGGDEFTVLLAGADDEAAEALARSLIGVFDQPFEVGAQSFSIGCSIGLCPYPQEGRDVDTIIRKADLAMYEAKQSGRGRMVRYHGGLADAVERRADLQMELGEAIQARALHVVYQPQVWAGERTVFGVEALARWIRRSGEEVSPSEFVPLADDMGLVGDLGRLVREQALSDIGRLHARGHRLSVSVNVSALELFADSFADEVADLVARTGFDPTRLEIEITESTAIQSPDLLCGPIRQLKALGVRFAIDDFGVGYSRLSALSSLPFDTLKVDRSFVSDVHIRPDAQALLSAISAMAKSLSLETIAEGVEKAEEATLLEELGMSAMQGFYFARPKRIDALHALMDECVDVSMARAPGHAAADRAKAG